MSSRTKDDAKKKQAAELRSLDDAAVKSASSLMGLQLLSRLVTFVLNQALVRLATPAVYGTVSIQLELLLNTILFLSREGFRNALLRADVDPKGGAHTRSVLVSNIALLPLYFGLLVSVLTSAAYMHYASLATKAQQSFGVTVALYTLAAVLELFSEPLLIRSMQTLNSTLRIRAEGSAVIVKSVATVAVLVYDSYGSGQNGQGHLALLGFGIGQLAYSICLLLVYLSEYGSSVSYKLRKSKAEKSRSKSSNSLSQDYFDKGLLDVSLAMTTQSVVKHVLTEGDKLVISRISPLKDQGGYAVASNYGALIARIIFQPIEETSRLFFSKALSVTDKKDPSSDAVQTAISRLNSMLLIYSHFSLILLTLAPKYLNIVLSVMLPPKYLNTSAPAILSAWIYYIPVLAVNGVLEAFVSSVASPKDLTRQSQWMAGASVAYILLTIALYQVGGLGDTSVIYANIINLTARIIYCAVFIGSYVQRKSQGKITNFLSTDEILPPKSALAAFLAAALVTHASFATLDIAERIKGAGKAVIWDRACQLHVGVGAVSGLVIVSVCYLAERRQIHQLLSALSSRRRQKTD